MIVVVVVLARTARRHLDPAAGSTVRVGLEPHHHAREGSQGALAGQGVALARLALVAEALARGELVEPLGAAGRLRSPYAYWLVRWPARRERPALAAFEDWLLEQAAQTREELQREPLPA